MEQNELIEIRLECLRYAIEFGSARDVLEPHLLADTYFEWVMRGSDEKRPAGSRKDDSATSAKKARSVRKGSAPTLV